MTLTDHTREQLAAALRYANGRRRERTMYMAEIEKLIRECPPEPGGFLFDHGGMVANAYDYRAYTTTAISVRRSDGGIALAVGPTDGHRGASPRPQWLRNDIPTVRDCANAHKAALAWADKAVNRLTQEQGAGGAVVIPAEEL